MGDDAELRLEPTFKALTELSGDSILLLDRNHRIIYINRTAEGLSVEEALGTVLFDLLTEDQATIARRAFHQAEQTGKKTSYEITFLFPMGDSVAG